MNKIKDKIRLHGDEVFLTCLVESGELNQLVCTMRACCVPSVSIREKLEVALAAISVVYHFTYRNRGREIMTRLVAVPDLFASLVSLCGEHAVLGNSRYPVFDICRIAYCVSYNSPASSAVLVDAGWAELLVKALKVNLDNAKMVSNIIDVLLRGYPAVWRVALIAAGAEAAIEEAIERYPTGLYVKKETLEMLRERH